MERRPSLVAARRSTVGLPPPGRATTNPHRREPCGNEVFACGAGDACCSLRHRRQSRAERSDPFFVHRNAMLVQVKGQVQPRALASGGAAIVGVELSHAFVYRKPKLQSLFGREDDKSAPWWMPTGCLEEDGPVESAASERKGLGGSGVVHGCERLGEEAKTRIGELHRGTLWLALSRVERRRLS